MLLSGTKQYIPLSYAFIFLTIADLFEKIVEAEKNIRSLLVTKEANIYIQLTLT